VFCGYGWLGVCWLRCHCVGKCRYGWMDGWSFRMSRCWYIRSISSSCSWIIAIMYCRRNSGVSAAHEPWLWAYFEWRPKLATSQGRRGACGHFMAV